VGVKGGPSREVADEWLQRYPADASVMAYLGRSGWNDLSFRGAIPDDELLEAVDESYRMVVSKLPRRHRPDGWDARWLVGRISGGGRPGRWSARPAGR
jgi:hypothetical protein